MTTVSQSAFVQALLTPATDAPDGLRNATGGPAGKRFDVYRNNVAVGLTEALRAAFPVVHKLVGDKFFAAMAALYLRNHPPSSPLMMFYGEEMPSFLKGFEPVAHLPYLPDVARLELAIRQSYHAADATPIGAGALAAIPPDRLVRTRFKIAPAVRLLSSRFPVHTIWLTNMTANPPKYVNRAEDVLITRRDFDPKLHFLPRPQARFVASLMKGDTLASATALAGEEFDLGATLGILFANGVLTATY